MHCRMSSPAEELVLGREDYEALQVRPATKPRPSPPQPFFHPCPFAARPPSFLVDASRELSQA